MPTDPTNSAPAPDSSGVSARQAAKISGESGVGQDALPRVLGYARCSTTDQDLLPQEVAIRDACRHRGWELVEVLKEHASGKSTDGRPELERALVRLEAGEASGLVVAKLDRLTRSTVDFGRLLERLSRGSLNLVVVDFDIDTSTPMGEMFANVLMSFAQYERKLIGQRTREALRAKKEAGTLRGKQGRGTASIGVRKRILELREKGLTWKAIADELNSDGVPTVQGGPAWRGPTVSAIWHRSVDSVGNGGSSGSTGSADVPEPGIL